MLSTFFVATTGNDSNAGSTSAPFRTIGKALATVQAGDTILVRDGTYQELLTTQRAGTASQRITLQAEHDGGATVTRAGRLLNVQHPYYTIDGLVFDGQFGAEDLVTVSSSANNLIIRDSEVRRGSRDGIDMSAAQNVLIENSKIHDLIWFDAGARLDAHGVVIAGAKNLTIRGTEIYYVSGDAFQSQYGGWDNVLIENSDFWNGPLPQAVAGAPAGSNPGENAIDTKQDGTVPAGHITMKNSKFHGWKSDFIANSAALNLKQNIVAVANGNTLYDNEIALRLRGPGSSPGATVRAMNNVIYNNVAAVRYEDQIADLHIWNNTFGSGNSTMFVSAGGVGSGFQVLNNLFLAGSKPSEAADSSNRAVTAASFQNAANHDYHLVTTSPAVDTGTALAGVTTDRDGNARPFGTAYDVGAYEYRTGVPSFVQSIDDGGAGYSSVGSWLYSSGQGHGGDVRYSAMGSGSDIALWTFNVTTGRYRVSASWFAHSNRASDAPYTILDGSNVLGTVRINQKLTPNDFSDGGTSWEDLGGPRDITGNTLVVQLSDAANGYVIADAVRIERVADNAAPEIEVLDGSTNINDGGTVNFGSTSTNVAVTKQLTVRNVGTFNLALTPLVPSALPSGYSLVTNFGSTTLLPGASTTFTIRLNSATAGTYGGTLSFGNSDANENPFDLALQGTVVASTIQIIDDGEAGFSSVGSWLYSSGQGRGGDVRYSALGSGSNVARWTFSVTPGRYRVSASWFAHSNRATDAPYRILNGSNVLGTVRVNQRLAANDLSYAGTSWEDLGGPYDITSNTLVVELSNAANGYVIADAVRIERIG
jgi:hypothetical protein